MGATRTGLEMQRNQQIVSATYDSQDSITQNRARFSQTSSLQAARTLKQLQSLHQQKATSKF